MKFKLLTGSPFGSLKVYKVRRLNKSGKWSVRKYWPMWLRKSNKQTIRYK